MTLIKIKSSAILKSILWGALFFCPYCLSAQNTSVRSDSAVIQDSTRFMRDRIRERKLMGSDSSSINMADSSLIHDENALILNDTLYVQNDTLLTQNDTVLIQNDSLILLKESTTSKNKKTREHSPPRATILSAVVPGMGQAYNRKYWKIPIIYGAGIGLYLYFDYANERFDYWKDVYEDELAKGTEGDQRVIDNAITNRDVWSKRRGYSVIFMGLLYVANVVDAMVDAHFLKFNVSDDLSMRIAPNLDPIPSQFAFDSFSYGVKLSLNF